MKVQNICVQLYYLIVIIFVFRSLCTKNETGCEFSQKKIDRVLVRSQMRKFKKNLLGIWNFVREQIFARIQKTSISTRIILDGSFKLLEQENLPGEEGPD